MLLTEEGLITRTLEAFNLINNKIDGRIKGSTFANVSRHCSYIKDGETLASPIVSLEALCATLVVDANELRNVVTFDVTGAFINDELPKDRNIS